MPRAVPTCILATAALLLAGLPIAASGGSADTPIAQAAKGCSIKGQQRSLGVTYVLTLRVRVTKCGDAKRVVRAYHACRHRQGRAGRCTGKVLGYRCSERRLDQSPTQYDARARCTKGGREVFHIYTQNT
jgi:hypothetical protein